MAEILVGGAFLSSILNVLFERLASRQVLDFFRKKKLDEKLFMRLETLLMTVSVVLDDAETKEVTHHAVKQWLEELKDVIYHAEDVLDEIVTRASKPKKGTFSLSKFFTNKKFDVKRVEDIVFRMELLASKKVDLGLHERRVVGDHNSIGGGRTTTSLVEAFVYGRDDDKQKIVESLLMDVPLGAPIPVITITGMGGKKFLLVLDDVWNEDYSKWRMLCAHFITVSSGSKIIVTTRNESVASIVRTSQSHPVEQLSELSDENGWKLFADHAFESRNRDDYPHLQVIGKQIVKKCKGLPLAIKALAGVLRNKDDVKAWECVMKSEIWGLPPVGNSSILLALILSYHYLPTHLKRCFAYCSIFPQDYEFQMEKLVLLWMAEGFVIDDTNKSMEEVGEEYFNELFSRSFFQNSSSSNEKYFVMHDLNHDLATYVSGKFCHNSERSKTLQLSEKVRHLSYSPGKSDDYQKLEPISKAKYLRTFLPVEISYNHDPCLSIAIIRDLLPTFSCIRVLSLSSYRGINELPDLICTLMHLRYLDLSHTSIQSLPDRICQLYNLQTLLISNCSCLLELPTNLGELVNLRHLDINGTYLNKLPPQIRRLESLQTLNRFIVGEGNCSGLGELNGLRQLKGSLSITGLHNVKNVEDVIEANLEEKMGIKRLSFEWGKGIEVSNNHSLILDKLRPSANLNHLTLDNYGGTRLSNWLGDGSLFNLTYLKISNCEHCLSLPSLGQLPSLVELHFENMISVTRVGSDFYGNGSSSVKPFQKLAILNFCNMYEWEEWSSSGAGVNDDFPKLETLWIQECPKLCGNLPKLLPSLRDLGIHSCRELNVIIPRDASPRSVQLEGCKNIVFENLSCLKSLISLDINGFRSIYFPMGGILENCTNLERLKIISWPEISCCDNLQFLATERFHKFKHLQQLTLRGNCDSMTSFFPLGSFPNLESLNISFLKNLESFSIEDEDEDHENLKDLSLRGCDKFINFPSGGLRTPGLRKFKIGVVKV